MEMLPYSFVSEAELRMAHQFQEQGYVISRVADERGFQKIQELIGATAADTVLEV